MANLIPLISIENNSGLCVVSFARILKIFSITVEEKYSDQVNYMQNTLESIFKISIKSALNLLQKVLIGHYI